MQGVEVMTGPYQSGSWRSPRRRKVGSDRSIGMDQKNEQYTGEGRWIDDRGNGLEMVGEGRRGEVEEVRGEGGSWL